MMTRLRRMRNEDKDEDGDNWECHSIFSTASLRIRISYRYRTMYSFGTYVSTQGQ